TRRRRGAWGAEAPAGAPHLRTTGSAGRERPDLRASRRRAPKSSEELAEGERRGLVDLYVAVGGRAGLLGGDELGGEGVDLAVAGVDVHDGGLVALQLGRLVV